MTKSCKREIERKKSEREREIDEENNEDKKN